VTIDVLQLLDSLRDTRYSADAEQATKKILITAKKELDGDDYESLEFHSTRNVKFDLRGYKTQDAATSPVLICTISAREFKREIFIPNFEFFAENPREWHTAAVGLLADEDADVNLKRVAVIQMGTIAKQDKRARIRLKHVLRESGPLPLRVTAAHALSMVAAGLQNAKKLLVGQLDDPSSPEELVEACVSALRSAVRGDQELQHKLLVMLSAEVTSDKLKAAAAYALGEVAEDDQDVADHLANLANTCSYAPLKLACVYALEAVASLRLDDFIGWAYSDDLRSRAACQILAEAIADGKVPMDTAVLNRIEHVLGSLGKEGQDFGEPCGHSLSALQRLLDCRAQMGDMTTERVLADALAPFKDVVRHAFIFGSIARNEQGLESDIDIMLIGGVSLRDVATTIKQAENQLGRTITTMTYSSDRFQAMLQSGDPFIDEVLRKPKTPINMGRGISESELNDELRSMATE
jgi:predicted nucleotidyltransferase